MMPDSLKKVSIEDLENSIAKAVSNLTGTDIVCDISKLDMSNMLLASLEISLREDVQLDP